MTDGEARKSDLISWWPYVLLDEAMPEGRASPEDWIDWRDGLPFLVFGDEDWPPRALSDGETVQFVSQRDDGQAVLTLADDRSWIISEPMPAAARQCCVLDGLQSETIATSVGEMVKQLLEVEDGPGQYNVAFYTFSNATPFRLDRATRRFHFDPSPVRSMGEGARRADEGSLP